MSPVGPEGARVSYSRERLGIGLEPEFPDGAHAFHRGELIEHVHGLHGDGEADAVGDPRAETGHVSGFAARDAAVVRIEEAFETDARAPGRRSRTTRSRRASLVSPWARYLIVCRVAVTTTPPGMVWVRFTVTPCSVDFQYSSTDCSVTRV